MGHSEEEEEEASPAAGLGLPEAWPAPSHKHPFSLILGPSIFDLFPLPAFLSLPCESSHHLASLLYSLSIAV